MPIAAYEQGVATKTIGVKVTNVPEQVPDYAFDGVTGFNFNGVTNVMTGTYIPVTVTIDGAGDPGPYRYDHMLLSPTTRMDTQTLNKLVTTMYQTTTPL